MNAKMHHQVQLVIHHQVVILLDFNQS